jgi:hypothetical protein
MAEQRLVDYAERQKAGRPLTLIDVADQELTIMDVKFSKGNFGIYAIANVVNVNGESLQIMTSGVLVVDALQRAEDAGAFPLKATFGRKGRTWTIS